MHQPGQTLLTPDEEYTVLWKPGVLRRGRHYVTRANDELWPSFVSDDGERFSASIEGVER